jgi:ribosomal protein L37AE/L43A
MMLVILLNKKIRRTATESIRCAACATEELKIAVMELLWLCNACHHEWKVKMQSFFFSFFLLYT